MPNTVENIGSYFNWIDHFTCTAPSCIHQTAPLTLSFKCKLRYRFQTTKTRMAETQNPILQCVLTVIACASSWFQFPSDTCVHLVSNVKRPRHYFVEDTELTTLKRLQFKLTAKILPNLGCASNYVIHVLGHLEHCHIALWRKPCSKHRFFGTISFCLDHLQPPQPKSRQVSNNGFVRTCTVLILSLQSGQHNRKM